MKPNDDTIQNNDYTESYENNITLDQQEEDDNNISVKDESPEENSVTINDIKYTNEFRPRNQRNV